MAFGTMTRSYAADANRLPPPPSCSAAPGASGAAFPQAARDAKIYQGSATVSFFVSPSGQIHDAKLESVSNPIFAQYALEAVMQLRCLNPAEMEMPTHFTLEFRAFPMD
jgi:TonB family protein